MLHLDRVLAPQRLCKFPQQSNGATVSEIKQGALQQSSGDGSRGAGRFFCLFAEAVRVTCVDPDRVHVRVLLSGCLELDPCIGVVEPAGRTARQGWGEW